MKKKRFYVLFANLILLVFTFGCVSQNLQSKSFEQYEIVNTHFKGDNEVKLVKETTNSYVSASILRSLGAWNEANFDLGNINNNKIDFNELFTEEEFKKHIDSFLSVEKRRLNQKLVSPNILLRGKANNIVSFPYIFVSSKNNHYGLLYSETINGPENGSGEVYLYEKKDNTWALIFTFSLWIS